jgi:cation diffusion facilitator CzcD-associated flavoprotein CzcO
MSGNSPSARVCVVGAGPCGLTAVKNLLAEGIDFVCYEEAPFVGGNWVYDDSSERRSVYRATRLISSKRLSEFEDFPMPEDYPDFPSHRQMLDYFNAYATHFKLLPKVVLNTRVESARRLDDGSWSVETTGPEGKRVETFDYLIVCSGHHRDPLMPEYPGTFTGRTLHSREYKRPEPFTDERVLVVGGGNSACDIAVDVSRVATSVGLSMREGYYILPKIVFGRPIDQLYARARNHWLRYAPHFVFEAALKAVVSLAVGPWRKYGLQTPKGSPSSMHPTLNTAILAALRDGAVRARPGIARFDGRTVHFSDESSDTFDTIIWGTGYRIGYPFLENTIMGRDFANAPPLYLTMMHPQIANLFFIGLFQPIGCIWRLADYQARIAALQIKGELKRPDDVAARAAAEVGKRRERFGAAPRHLVEVDYHDFRSALLRELGNHAVPAGPAS